MYKLTIVCGSTSRVNIQDPYPADGGFSLSLEPGQTKVTHLLNSEFDRIKPTLDQMVIEGLVSYTALDGPASELSNDSSVPGVTIARIDGIDAVTAQCVGYGIRLGKGCRVVCADASTPTGTLGAIRFDQSGTTVAYPAAKAWVTDGMGSSVIA